MKTKPFLLATAGSTVDGRTIDDKMLTEIASSYDPKTYSARLNIEHVRGIGGQAPFRAYGDVLELSTGEVDVNFNGKTEKRLGLFGTFDVTDEAKALNDAGQKVHPSIEIEPNFAGKGFAYLMGCALTDSPASIATDRLQFSRHLPGTIVLSRGADGQPEGALDLEFAAAGDPAGTSILGKVQSMLDGFAAKFSPAPKTEPKPDEKPEAAAFSVADLRGLFEGFGQTVTADVDALRTEMRSELDRHAVQLKALEKTVEGTPAHDYRARPPADGGNADYSDIF